jgi:hypothetical protein
VRIHRLLERYLADETGVDAPRRRRLEELIPAEWHDGPAPAR